MSKSITLIFLILSILNTSFGMVKHTHVCDTTHQEKQGFVKQRCEMDMKEPSCHEPAKDSCCENSSEFDTQDQVNQDDEFSFSPEFLFAFKTFITLSEESVIKPIIEPYPRPPNIRYSLLYQQILC